MKPKPGIRVLGVIRAPLEIEFQEQEGRAQIMVRTRYITCSDFFLPACAAWIAKSHGQAAADQHRGVGGAELHVEQVAADFECGQVQRAINHVGGEKAAEEHDFSDQEHPHAEAIGLALLVHVLELMRESRRDARARHVRPSQPRGTPAVPA